MAFQVCRMVRTKTSGTWCCEVLWIGTNMSEEPTTSIFRMVEAEGSGFLKDLGVNHRSWHHISGDQNVKYPHTDTSGTDTNLHYYIQLPHCWTLLKEVSVTHFKKLPLSVHQKVHHHQKKSWLAGSNLVTIVQVFTTYFFQIQFNIILPSIYSSANLLSMLKFTNNKLGNAHRA
jgi:hypothetical protein